MSWDERQRRMLAAMGLRVWSPTVGADDDAEGDAVAVAVDGDGEAGVDASAHADADAAAHADAAPAGAAHANRPRAVPTAAAPPRTGLVTAPIATPAAVAALDWPGLRAAVAACAACTLSATRTQTVFGVGHAQAHWMVVGEAPGEQEDLHGEPFVGPAGQLLDRMLAALNLTRSEDGDEPPARRAYIANTLKCRPPRNRNPSPEELQRCEPFLVRQIELVRPRIILAMGAFAVRALLRSELPVGKLRGQVHAYQGVPLVVTYHPAYLLRSLGEKAKAWEDLCLAASVVERAAAAHDA
jgi:DNA polymerase